KRMRFPHVRAVILLCGSTAMAASLPSVPTFYKDIAPILQEHCAQCHRTGEVAPMPLLTYEQVRPWAAAIKEAVILRKMPPWFADAPRGHFTNDTRLSEEQIAVIRKWAESSAPEGDAKDSPAPKQFTEGWQSGKPDVILRLPHEEKLPGNGQDVWKFIFFDKTFEQETWIRGLEIRPGNRKVVHHANVFIVTPEGKGPADWSSVPEDLEAAQNKAGKLAGFQVVTVHVGLPGRFSFQTEQGSAVRIPK